MKGERRREEGGRQVADRRSAQEMVIEWIMYEKMIDEVDDLSLQCLAESLGHGWT